MLITKTDPAWSAHLQSQEEQLELDKAELRGLGEGHPGESGGQRLRVHLTSGAWNDSNDNLLTLRNHIEWILF